MTLLGYALVAAAIVAPIAYCEVQRKDPFQTCIEMKGEWKAEGWGPYTCHFPKPT
jgi:hypothetical protein